MLPDIYIAIPTARDWKPEFGCSMIGLSVHLMKLKSKGLIRGFYVNNKIAALLSMGRQMLLDEALAGDWTHILWVDDDQQFTARSFDLMFSRNKEFVSANICKKTFDNGGFIASAGEGKKINSVGRTGIEKASTTGLGYALLQLEPLRKTKRPHFETVWVDEAEKYIGEDVYFCAKLQHDLGIFPWIDHDASQEVNHVGNHGYGVKDFVQQQIKEAV